MTGQPGLNSKSQPEHCLFWLMYSVVFLSHSRQVLLQYLEITQDCIPPHPFQYIIYNHLIIRRWLTDGVVKLSTSKFPARGGVSLFTTRSRSVLRPILPPTDGYQGSSFVVKAAGAWNTTNLYLMPRLITYVYLQCPSSAHGAQLSTKTTFGCLYM
jgi:hypothetical protein